MYIFNDPWIHYRDNNSQNKPQHTNKQCKQQQHTINKNKHHTQHATVTSILNKTKQNNSKQTNYKHTNKQNQNNPNTPHFNNTKHQHTSKQTRK